MFRIYHCIYDFCKIFLRFPSNYQLCLDLWSSHSANSLDFSCSSFVFSAFNDQTLWVTGFSEYSTLLISTTVEGLTNSQTLWPFCRWLGPGPELAVECEEDVWCVLPGDTERCILGIRFVSVTVRAVLWYHLHISLDWGYISIIWDSGSSIISELMVQCDFSGDAPILPFIRYRYKEYSIQPIITPIGHKFCDPFSIVF